MLDTGVFDQDRYFDVFVEYAKESPADLLIQISIHNRGPETAELHVLPTLWFRNQWSWHAGSARPGLRQASTAPSYRIVEAVDPKLGERYLAFEGAVPLLFTENETNTQRIFGVANRSPYVKDGINDYVVHGRKEAVNPEKTGTKVAADYHLSVPAGGCQVVRLRLSSVAPAPAALSNGDPAGPFGSHFEEVFEARRNEADEFYGAVIPTSLDADAANVMRQALAGMMWSKQFYHYDVDKWLEERGSDPFKATRKAAPRNDHWHHMYNGDVISMPDKWEYPWYAAWDLAFHVLALTLVGSGFRQAATEADAARAVHAPQRPDPGLRVELRRRQSAGTRLVHHFHLPTREGTNGRGRPRLAQELLSEAALELYLVGEPQGSVRTKRVRGRLSGPGQHRRVRSQCAACRPAATWNRPTAPPGWPSSARTCSKSPWSWR